MKKLLLLTAVILMGCSAENETVKNSCNCEVKTYVNDVWNSEKYSYSKDCKDDGKIIQSFTEGNFVVKKIVKCN